MKIFVSGREGQLARSLARVAQRRGVADVRFAGRDEVDLAVPGAFADTIRLAAPDLVINTAAYTQVDKAETEEALAMRINGEAAGEGARAAAEIGAAFFQISTDYVFDGEKGAPYREDDAVSPLGAYGRTKLTGEAAVATSGARHLIVRTSWAVSPFGQNFVRTMLRLAETRDEIGVVADQHGCPTSALALAEALLDIAPRFEGESGVLHLAGSGQASWAELASVALEQFGLLGGPTATVRPITTADYPTPAPRPRDTRLDCTLAESRFGVRLPPWRDSVETIVRELCEGANG